MAKWRIIDGPAKRMVPVDGQVWGCVIENTNDPAQRRFIGATISGTVLECDREGLDERVRQAIETDGLSVIEPYLDEQDPPAMILVTSTGIRVEPVE